MLSLRERWLNSAKSWQALVKLPQPELAGPVREWIIDKYITAQDAGRV